MSARNVCALLAGAGLLSGGSLPANAENALWNTVKQHLMPPLSAADGASRSGGDVAAEVVKWRQQALENTARVTALAQLQRLAGLGHVDALNSLGYFYDNGLAGLPLNALTAARYFKESAARTDPIGMFNLGVQLYFGRRGLPSNRTDALPLIRRAHERLGLVRAATVLALEAEKNQDFQGAAAMYLHAAKRGAHAFPSKRLGLMYYKGIGVPRSSVAALDYLQYAADRWDVEAQFAMAEIYGGGIGMDAALPAEALLWAGIARRHASQGALAGKIEQFWQWQQSLARATSPPSADLDAVARSVESWIAAHPYPKLNDDFTKTLIEAD